MTRVRITATDAVGPPSPAVSAMLADNSLPGYAEWCALAKVQRRLERIREPGRAFRLPAPPPTPLPGPDAADGQAIQGIIADRKAGKVHPLDAAHPPAEVPSLQCPHCLRDGFLNPRGLAIHVGMFHPEEAVKTAKRRTTTTMDKLRRAWRRASAEEREQFMRWAATIPAPKSPGRPHPDRPLHPTDAADGR